MSLQRLTLDKRSLTDETAELSRAETGSRPTSRRDVAGSSTRIRLFDRHPQGVELTSYGQALLDCGVIVFDEMRQGLIRIDYLKNPTSGELRIGCPEIMIVGIVPTIVERFSRQ